MRIGLEISDRTLTLVWTRSRRGGRVEWRIRTQPRSQPQPHDSETLHRDLAQLLRPLSRNRVLAQLTLAASTSSVRSLSLEASTIARIPDALREKLPTLLPFDLEQAEIQFVIRRQQRVDEHVEALLSVAACERIPLQQQLDALWRIGWVPSAVVAPALALVKSAKALNLLNQGDAVMVEVGEGRSTIVLVEEGEVVYARDVALGVEQLTDALCAQVSIGTRTVSLSREQAAALLHRVGVPDAGQQAHPPAGEPDLPLHTYLAMIQPVLEQLVSEIRRTMTFGTRGSGDAAAGQRLLLSGEGLRLPGCDHWLARQLGATVTPLTCEHFLGGEGLAAAVPCGLAAFDRPPALNLQPRVFRHRRTCVRVAMAAWCGLLAATVCLWVGIGVWQVRRQAVATELHQLQTSWTDLQPVATLQEAIDSHERLMRQLVVEEGVELAWFRRLARGFPKPVRLTSVSVAAAGGVRLSGEAQQREQTPEASVSELMLWLQQAQVCHDVKLESSRRAAAGSSLVEFTLACQRAR